MKHNNSNLSTWKLLSTRLQEMTVTKKVPLLNMTAAVTLICFVISISLVPKVLSEHHGDDGDLREEIAIGAGAIGALAGAIAWAGAAAAGTATAPVWVPVAGGIAVGACLIAGGVALWDRLDGPEDDCYDCDGSGCDTCEPPDDDDCPNCDGTGCDTCQPPPPPPPRKRQGGRSLQSW